LAPASFRPATNRETRGCAGHQRTGDARRASRDPVEAPVAAAFELALDGAGHSLLSYRIAAGSGAVRRCDTYVEKNATNLFCFMRSCGMRRFASEVWGRQQNVC